MPKAQRIEGQAELALIFVISLPYKQAMAIKKKKGRRRSKKAKCENHTQTKYDSQININHWSIDKKAVRHMRNSS